MSEGMYIFNVSTVSHEHITTHEDTLTKFLKSQAAE